MDPKKCVKKKKGNRLVSSTDYLDVFRPHIIHQLRSQNYRRFVKHFHTLVNLHTFSNAKILYFIFIFFTSNAKIVKQVPRRWGKSLYGEKSHVTQLRKNCFLTYDMNSDQDALFFTF